MVLYLPQTPVISGLTFLQRSNGSGYPVIQNFGHILFVNFELAGIVETTHNTLKQKVYKLNTDQKGSTGVWEYSSRFIWN